MTATAHATSDILGRRAGTVYGLCVPTHRAIYVGQTIDMRGPVNRFVTHLGVTNGSSLRSQLEKNFGMPRESDLGEAYFQAVPLDGAYPGFHYRASDYREAVERLVHQKVLRHITSNGMRLVLISTTRPGRYTLDPLVQTEATKVAGSICLWLNDLATTYDFYN